MYVHIMANVRSVYNTWRNGAPTIIISLSTFSNDWPRSTINISLKRNTSERHHNRFHNQCCSNFNKITISDEVMSTRNHSKSNVGRTEVETGRNEITIFTKICTATTNDRHQYHHSSINKYRTQLPNVITSCNTLLPIDSLPNSTKFSLSRLRMQRQPMEIKKLHLSLVQDTFLAISKGLFSVYLLCLHITTIINKYLPKVVILLFLPTSVNSRIVYEAGSFYLGDIYGYEFNSEPATFGRHFVPIELSQKANLFLPPEDDPYLCNTSGRHLFKKSLDKDMVSHTNFSIDSRLVNFNEDNSAQSIALLVERGGGCDFGTKARNALTLNERMNVTGSTRIEYLVVFNDLGNNEYLQMGSSVENHNLDIGLVFVTGNSGVNLRDRMDQLFKMYQGTFPGQHFHYVLDKNAFFHNENEDYNHWKFSILIDGMHAKYFEESEINFQPWLKIAFGILIFAIPFHRCLINNGRMLRWRRNDRGRITGIRYVSRRDITISQLQLIQLFTSETDETVEQSNKITIEDVMALPEVIYCASMIVDDNSSDINDLTNGLDKCAIGDPAILNDKIYDHFEAKAEVLEDIVYEKLNKNKDSSDQSSCNIDIEMKSDNEENKDDSFTQTVPHLTKDKISAYLQPLEESILSSRIRAATKSCIQCSVCIDEFEDGEKVRLLPRCGHVYHTECILPWLTNQHGCCPLCKQDVLRNGSTSSESSNGQNNHSESVV